MMLHKCTISNNSKDGVNVSGCKVEMYGCTAQNNEGAVIRIANDDPITVKLYLKNKPEELNY